MVNNYERNPGNIPCFRRVAEPLTTRADLRGVGSRAAVRPFGGMVGLPLVV